MTGKDFYSPGEVRFTVRQTIWLIQNLGSLREGCWPPDYLNIMVRGKGPRKAPFETPIWYAVEIQVRMERCGIDGLILEAIECWGKSVESLAGYFRMPEWSIRKRRKTALGYVASGPARRWLTARKRTPESYGDYKRRSKWTS